MLLRNKKSKYRSKKPGVLEVEVFYGWHAVSICQLISWYPDSTHFKSCTYGEMSVLDTLITSLMCQWACLGWMRTLSFASWLMRTRSHHAGQRVFIYLQKATNSCWRQNVYPLCPLDVLYAFEVAPLSTALRQRVLLIWVGWWESQWKLCQTILHVEGFRVVLRPVPPVLAERCTTAFRSEKTYTFSWFELQIKNSKNVVIKTVSHECSSVTKYMSSFHIKNT